MKHTYIKDILQKYQTGDSVEIQCWIKSKRTSGSIAFFEIEDSTGSISTTIQKDAIGNPLFNEIYKITKESSVSIKGIVQNSPSHNQKEINVTKLEIINKATKVLSPSPRELKNPFKSKLANQILSNRHLYIRNSKIASVMRIKHKMLISLREWLNNDSFVEIDTPILTQSNVYDNVNTFDTDYFGTTVYLSQCAGLYLGAAIPALEKVYTVTPAFRKESSKSPRHNPEFYHLKGQMAFYNLEETINLTEKMIYHTVTSLKSLCKDDFNNLNVDLDTDMYKPPYPKITYLESLNILKSNGINIKIGQSLNEKAEQCIADKFNRPVFVVNMPAEVEPFPYMLTEDKRFTKTADLLIPNGFGEILGVAEFIYDHEELINRMKEKNKNPDTNSLNWYINLTEFGNVPRGGFGMGVERFLRVLLKLDHIRDCFLFPRLYDRKPYP